ncbi:hypothetical protein BDQ17DRAFT_1426854 [Cyathus striatus]|nr:hypothetical protein BDQ17DRAFT_1426854 [Cyathus striatus]
MFAKLVILVAAISTSALAQVPTPSCYSAGTGGVSDCAQFIGTFCKDVAASSFGPGQNGGRCFGVNGHRCDFIAYREITDPASPPSEVNCNTVLNGVVKSCHYVGYFIFNYLLEIDEPCREAKERLALDLDFSLLRLILMLEPALLMFNPALKPPPEFYYAQIHLRPLPPIPVLHTSASARTSQSPHHLTQYTPPNLSKQSLITPYNSFITPSSPYLSDPLNGYAHSDMPRHFVHLVRPPLDVTLDARVTGGYRPNAVIRLVLCPYVTKRTELRAESKKLEERGTMLPFGIFAVRDLEANEEVVLGWERDDENPIHNLPALIETPKMFP